MFYRLAGMNIKLMFSSATPEWETPQDLFDKLNTEFNFDLDVCATQANAKCKLFYSSGSLEKQWPVNMVKWMNPPYGKVIGLWVKKASENPLTVCLLPARTDTRWFHDYIYGKAEIRFIKGRLKFGQATNSAPFPSLIAIFRNK